MLLLTILDGAPIPPFSNTIPQALDQWFAVLLFIFLGVLILALGWIGLRDEHAQDLKKMQKHMQRRDEELERSIDAAGRKPWQQ